MELAQMTGMISREALLDPNAEAFPIHVAGSKRTFSTRQTVEPP